MRKKKKQLEKNLSVDVLIALILTVTFACKHSQSQSTKEHKKHFQSVHGYNEKRQVTTASKYICIEYYKNFAIDTVRMSRVTVEGIPSKGYVFYILETHIAGCNHETIRRNTEILGGVIHPFHDGLNDSIRSIIFSNKYKTISPKPLHWSEKGERIHCNMELERISEEGYRDISVFYNGDYPHLPLDIKKPLKYATAFLNEILYNKDSLYYMITFDKRNTLPDSVTIIFSKKKMTIPIENSTILKYKLKSNSDFYEPEDIVYKKYKKARRKRI